METIRESVKRGMGGAIYGIASVTIFVRFLQIYPVHKNFTCNLAGYRLHFTHSNLIGGIRKSMRKKWIFTGAAFALAMTLTGCRDNAAASIPQQSSQEQTKEQTQMIPMEEAQEAALKAADIEAADADISATTLSEVAGVACYKVEFTSGEYAYSYTINAQTGAVMEMSSQEQNAQTSGRRRKRQTPLPRLRHRPQVQPQPRHRPQPLHRHRMQQVPEPWMKQQHRRSHWSMPE